jgi:type I restriction enzyme S subunit
MQEGWKIYKLGELMTLITDYHANGAYKKLKANVTLKDTKDYAAMIRSTNFEKNDFNDLKYIDEHAFHFLAKSKVNTGDVLMNKIANPGTVYFMPEMGIPISLGMNLFLLRFEETRVKPYYLYKYLKANQSYVKSFSGGSVTRTITKDAVKNLEIKLPSLKEQNAIASILSALDHKIELNKQMNKTLEEMALALYKHWFVDFGPFKSSLEGGTGDDDCELVDSVWGQLPKGWEVKTLDNWIDLNPRLSLPKGSLSTFVEMKALPVQAMSVSAIAKKEFKGGTKFQNGDTLFARITPCLENGKTAFVDFLEEKEIAFGSTEYLVMRAKKNVSKYWTYCIARDHNFRKFSRSTMVGTSGRQRVQKDPLLSYELAQPNATIFKDFTEKVEPWFHQIRMNTIETQTLTKLGDTLLPQLISGTISVKEALKQVHQV